MTRPLPWLLLVASLFGFVFNISFTVLPPLSTGRIVLALLFPLYIGSLPRAWKAVVGYHQPFLLCFLLITLYGAAVFGLSGAADPTQLSRLLNFFLYVLLGAALFAAAAGYDFTRFTTALAMACAIQACLIGYSFVTPAYRTWLGSLVVQAGNIPLDSAERAPGFSNSSGAALSLIQSLGVFSAILSARAAERWGRRVFWIVVALLSTLSTVVVGRTGLQASLLFIGLSVVIGSRQQIGRMALSLAIIGLVGFAVWPRLTAWIVNRNPSSAAVTEWAFEFFSHGTESGSVKELLEQNVPPLSLETVVGTGLVTAPDGLGNASGNDSGYIQMYYAIGLPITIVFYLALAGFLASRMRAVSRERTLLALFAAAMFVVEIKEPFVFKYAFAFVALVLLAVARDSTTSGDHASRAETA